MPKLNAIESKSVIRKIEKWLNDPDAKGLSKHDTVVFERIKFAYDRLQIYPQKKVINSLIKIYDVSQSQAYYDIRHCKKLFNPLNRHDKQFLQKWIADRIMIDIDLLRSKESFTATDFKSLSGLYGNLIKVAGLDRREDGENIDPELLGNNKLVAVFNFNNKQVIVNFDDHKDGSKKFQSEILQNAFPDIDIEDAIEIMSDGNEETTDK